MNAAVFPEPCPESLSDGLSLAGATVIPVSELDSGERWVNEADLLVAELGAQPMRRLREVNRIVEVVGIPVLLVIEKEQLALLESSEGISDFMVLPVNPLEVRLRLLRLVRDEESDELLRFKDLELNPLNYQAILAGEPMDLTFMEYELLRFLMENPVRVWSRQQLLSKVWGYDYYGGARTVDVHVRRLRAKLGEERASWITTVRSVGYRWG